MTVSRPILFTVLFAFGLPFLVRAGESERMEHIRKTTEKQRPYTKVLEMYDPGLWFTDKPKRDKGVEAVARPQWNEDVELPTESVRPALPQQPTRTEQDEEEDEDDWLRFITDPDAVYSDENEDADPWDSDVLSDPYKHLFGDDLKEAVEGLARPTDATREQEDDQDETNEDEELEEELLSKDEEDDHGLAQYEPTLSDQPTERTAGMDDLFASSMTPEEMAQLRLQQEQAGGEEPEEEQETLLTETWATLHAAGDGSATVRSSSDGLMSQTRSQLAAMAGGFSLFGDRETGGAGDQQEVNGPNPTDVQSEEHPGFSPTDLIDRSQFAFDEFDSAFAGNDLTAENAFAEEFGADAYDLGSDSSDFGDDFGTLRDADNFDIDSGFDAPGESTYAASSYDGAGRTDAGLNGRSESRAPVDRFGEADPFGSQSDRFKFLGE